MKHCFQTVVVNHPVLISIRGIRFLYYFCYAFLLFSLTWEFAISVSLSGRKAFYFHGWQGRKYYDVPNFPVPVDSLPIRNSIPVLP